MAVVAIPVASPRGYTFFIFFPEVLLAGALPFVEPLLTVNILFGLLFFVSTLLRLTGIIGRTILVGVIIRVVRVARVAVIVAVRIIAMAIVAVIRLFCFMFRLVIWLSVDTSAVLDLIFMFVLRLRFPLRIRAIPRRSLQTRQCRRTQIVAITVSVNNIRRHGRNTVQVEQNVAFGNGYMCIPNPGRVRSRFDAASIDNIVPHTGENTDQNVVFEFINVLINLNQEKQVLIRKTQ